MELCERDIKLQLGNRESNEKSSTNLKFEDAMKDNRAGDQELGFFQNSTFWSMNMRVGLRRERDDETMWVENSKSNLERKSKTIFFLFFFGFSSPNKRIYKKKKRRGEENKKCERQRPFKSWEKKRFLISPGPIY